LPRLLVQPLTSAPHLGRHSRNGYGSRLQTRRLGSGQLHSRASCMEAIGKTCLRLRHPGCPLEENNRQVWLFGAILIGTILKRSAGILRPNLQSIRFFDPSGFYHEFFDRFGPKDFMGLPLHGAWWILVYYAVVILVCNIGGEELWWRGYVLPRQELAFGRARGLSTGLSGRSSTYLCSRLSGPQSAWQSRVSHFPLLRNAQKTHGQASSATPSETWLSS